MPTLYASKRSIRRLQTAAAVKLPFPVRPEMRMAVLSDSAPVFCALKAFHPDSVTALEGYHPNILSGTVAELQEIANQVELGTVDLSAVDHAVIAFTQCGNAPVSDVARVVLWQTFGVPVYEIFTGRDQSILGYECELHEGWHLTSNVGLTEMGGELLLDAPGVSGLRTGLSGFITEDPCPCGRPGCRLLNIEPVLKADDVRQRWAAIA